jgi:lipopolysaccharide/colanic/teichoic acid biosynthesis glycosyltransferase
VLDVVVSSVAVIVFSPLMLLIVLAIKLDSPGPALFRQCRVGIDRRAASAGEDGSSPAGACLPAAAAPTQAEQRPAQDRRAQRLFGKPIYLYKFRTMYVDSRERFPDLYAYEYKEGELDSVPIKVLVGHRRRSEGGQGFEHADSPGNDPRVTRVGRWLRRTSLDELPNFLSVLGGDMALVGPRPDIAENVRWYQPKHLLKLRVKPGVTGLAQISGRGNLSFHETNELDVEYVMTRSLWGDLRIIVRTIGATLARHGAF